MLKLENVKKVYRKKQDEVVALDSTSVEIPRGDFVSIIGPSGSGKTTLLSMLGAMSAPSEGRILLDGESIYDLPVEQRAEVRQNKLGFVFQTFNLIPYLTAIENVQVPMMLSQKYKTERQQRAEELLATVGLQDRLQHKPSELSIGQQQRVALARMLANDPSIILADEPTGNLDPDTRDQVLSFLRQFNEEGRTIIMVTHDLSAAGCARRTLKLSEGRIQSGTEEDLKKSA
ncbi:ABC transporter ATP-binding protein [Gimesia chilikensis]|jgi:putative ABC transport system ATP-binding protein|uniref:Lipoprotein-releasing system ATP-binding protein LolD n=1 Tax=Gimesia chilikensis TaxID=2605989 RepID=A0A517PVK7_9PLAN|nr:ABC transporter ATP-binding protein [Gimesia chilikensis]MBN72771.1 ABC transporter [Gimesia sp.]MCR9230948.1 ABC transporter ATP-binding protein [bacterium]QDT23407.1 Lipoprotein-releasing system ATP-binding protein LolD [Gimesia chilikensis]QDT87293.1 Lipoprotein-releasing system ATP-binding protein LolD [Gimesia chilikensis]